MLTMLSGQYSQSLAITEASQIAEARRVAAELARAIHFSESQTGRVTLVVTEAATNLIKHAGRGQLLLRILERGGRMGLEILALDQGPGIPNPGMCMRDGYSTTGSPGTGLGAIFRLSAEFDLYSQQGRGTALLARLWTQRDAGRAAESRREDLTIDVGAICLPMPGEAVCGDGWAVTFLADRCLALLADGLGHGPDAAQAAQSAVRTLSQQPRYAPAALIELAHGAMRHTRGAALAVAELDIVEQTLRYAGVGNIAGVVTADGRSHHLMSHNGIVGHKIHKIQELTYPWPCGALVVMHSDGLTTHWDLNAYPGLAARSSGLIAGVLYRDYSRGRDDVTVLVVKAPTGTEKAGANVSASGSEVSRVPG
jgi:anti-sigma regulatory factor (Ser/Thr protein kinase)